MSNALRAPDPPVDSVRPETGRTPSTSLVSGVVLCGGRSRRMGRDKALLKLGGRSLLERAVQLLGEHVGELALACGSEPHYGDLGLRLILDPPEFRAAPDADRGPGPVAGLCAALDQLDAEWLVVLACDMPRVAGALIERLLQKARADELDVCLFESSGHLEPLCGVYRKSCLAPMRAALAAGRRQVTAFLDEARADGGCVRLGTVSESTLEPEYRSIRMAENLNRPEDLTRELARRARMAGDAESAEGNQP